MPIVPQCHPKILVFICNFCIKILLLSDLQTHRTNVGCRSRMDDKPTKHQIFLLLGKNESCVAEGCMGSLVALKGCPYLYVALRQHIYYYL